MNCQHHNRLACLWTVWRSCIVPRLGGKRVIVPVEGSIQGHWFVLKKVGFEVRYIELGIANPPGYCANAVITVPDSRLVHTR
jgi:hypothetical protein